MFQFIKKFFEKEEVEVALLRETIPFAEIEEWLQKHTNKDAKSIWDTAKPLLEKIEESAFTARANLTKLEHAELRNKSITGRELEIMKGNRSSYLKRTEQFLTTLASFYDKEEMTYKALKQLAEKYQEELKNYHDTTLKPYAVLQYFFANESYTVAKNIKEIDEEMKKLEVILKKQSVESLENVQEQIQTLKKKKQEEEHLQKEKNNSQEELERLRGLQKQAEEKKKKAEESDRYQKYLQEKEQLQQQEKKQKQQKEQLQHSFSVIEKALRKYAKEEPTQEECIQEYCEKPEAAIEKDSDLNIIFILEQVKQKVETNALEIKEDKKEKILLELGNLSKSFFETWRREYKKIQEEKKAKESILQADVALQQYKEAEYMVQTYQEKANTEEKHVGYLQEQIARLNLPFERDQLGKNISQVMKREIIIAM